MRAVTALAAPALALAMSPALAQSHDAHARHDAPTHPPLQHAGQAKGVQARPHDRDAGHDDHGDHGESTGHAAHADPAGHAGPAQAAATGDDATQQLPLEPVPVPTDADRRAAFPELHQAHHAHGSALTHRVDFTRMELRDADPGTGQAWEGSAWVGNDVRRLWLRSTGERSNGQTGAADLELLLGSARGPWSELLLGVRHDFRPGPSRTWAAIGLEGLAPYKFEVSAMAYLGDGGHSMFTVEVEYDMLLTNRLVLRPVLELEAHGRDDPRHGIGSGLSSAEASLRLAYEVTRQFAPYLGVVHQRVFGDTADHHRDAGEPVRDTRWVAGVRWWF